MLVFGMASLFSLSSWLGAQTPIPTWELGRNHIDPATMKEGIPEVDIYAIAEAQMQNSGKAGPDVLHGGPALSKLFAAAIIKDIEAQLEKKGK